jgi:hypothetical protein
MLKAERLKVKSQKVIRIRGKLEGVWNAEKGTTFDASASYKVH